MWKDWKRVAECQDSVDQVKGEIHKKELMKQAYPSGKRRASAAGGAKAGDVPGLDMLTKRPSFVWLYSRYWVVAVKA